MLNKRFAIGAVVVLLAVTAVAVGVLWAQDNDRNPTAIESNPYESQPWLDPRVVRQIPMSNAADKIHRLWQAGGFQSFTGMRFDNDKDELILYWKGKLPPQMSALVDELRATVPIRVVNSPYSLEELDAESRRLIMLRKINGVNIYGSGPTRDFSGIRLRIDTDDDRTDAQKIEAARQAIKSDFPLEFEVGGKLTLF
ncbi:MAG: hypothetical protein F4X72_12825 [Dehalococcoidia bacterium]|nr:hypothetical protein [Dehalococcoidia bacterium]